MFSKLSLRKTSLVLVRELNEKKHHRNTIRFVREPNKRRESNKIATPLDLLRVLNKERRKGRLETNY
jgi:uncharacterized protein (DUF2252 family)